MATSVDSAVRELGSSHGSSKRSRALFIPYPVQGQINPMMHLAKTLTNHDPNLHITFTNNYHYHTHLMAKLLDHGREASGSPSAKGEVVAEELSRTGFSKETLVQPNIGLVCVDNGLPADYDYVTAQDSLDRIRVIYESCLVMSKNLKLFIKHLEENEKQSCYTKVSFIAVGIFCDSAMEVGVDLGIPTVLFSTQSATALSMYLHVHLLISNGFFSEDTKFDEEQNPKLYGQDAKDQLVTYLPGIPALPPSSFPAFMHVHDASSIFIEFLRSYSDKLKLYNAILLNTFEELEGEASRALESEFRIPVYPIGPILAMGAKMKQEDENACITWLDKKSKHSVVYISFGTLWNPSVDLIKSIAEGIKASKQPYLWALRPSTLWPSPNVYDFLPEHFFEETDGLIIPWAPQLDVLAHPSVGVFLTHCGWNSTLESMSMGVPMIPIPIQSDQITNCKFIVDIWKVGVNVKFVLRSDGPVVSSDDVERAVNLIFHEDEGSEIRNRSQEFKTAIKRTTQCGGTSYTNIQKFIHSFEK